MEKFTASEVRSTIAANRDGVTDRKMEMLHAYADRLEVDEKAVRVRQFRVVPKGSTWTDVKDDEIWAAVTAHPESYETRVLYAHYAQAQPPARTCSDERPCVNCFADQGGCLGPAPETVRQRKEQRAVEIAAAISTRHEFSRHESPLILGIVRATLAAQENPKWLTR